MELNRFDNIDCITYGDSFELVEDIPDASVDLILEDMPYNMTENIWDIQINLNLYWRARLNILKPTGVIALTASQPFSSMLVTSNLGMFKHEWIWIKNRGSNFANTVREPFKEHEHVLIFSNGRWTYNKQMQERTGGGADRVKYDLNHRSKSENYREFEEREGIKLPNMRVPSSWQKFNTDTSGLHPTQKPVELFEYLIKTYTNKGDLVFDGFGGSGTTAIAATKLDRRFIVIEKKEDYYEAAQKRLENFRKQLKLAI